MTASDEQFLRQAIALSRQARGAGGDPFGAVLVRDGVIVHGANLVSRTSH